MDALVSLMQDYWKMNEPKPPEFIISVIGNTSSFVDDGDWKKAFGDTLVKVTTNFCHFKKEKKWC